MLTQWLDDIYEWVCKILFNDSHDSNTPRRGASPVRTRKRNRDQYEQDSPDVLDDVLDDIQDDIKHSIQDDNSDNTDNSEDLGDWNNVSEKTFQFCA